LKFPAAICRTWRRTCAGSVTGAGIEPALPLDWLPPQVVLLTNSGVHVEDAWIGGHDAADAQCSGAEIVNQRQAAGCRSSPQIRGRTVLIIGVGDMGGGVALVAN
jgi:hypothetical protein